MLCYVTRLLEAFRMPAALLLVSFSLPPAEGQTWEDLLTKTPIGLGETLVIGFLGRAESRGITRNDLLVNSLSGCVRCGFAACTWKLSQTTDAPWPWN